MIFVIQISRMIMRYHQDRMDDEKRAEKEEGTRLRRIAGQLAKQIKDFWSSIEKVCYATFNLKSF